MVVLHFLGPEITNDMLEVEGYDQVQVCYSHYTYRKVPVHGRDAISTTSSVTTLDTMSPISCVNM